MTRDGRIKAIEKKRKKLEPGYVECYYCDEPVKSRAMRCPHCGKWFGSGKKLLAVFLAAVILSAAVAGYYFIPGSPGYQPLTGTPTVLAVNPTGNSVLTTSAITVEFDREMNRVSVESAFSVVPALPGTFAWSGMTLTYRPTQPMTAGTLYSVTIQATATDLAGRELEGGYGWQFTTTSSATTSLRSIGTGSGQFWNRTTAHPAWVLAAVQVRPQLILTHSTGCAPCDTMISICEPLSAAYAGRIDYYNITSQIDEPEATDCFAAYDPDGEPHYVPLTTVVTKGPDNTIIWHSWEGVVDEVTLTGWIEDAIEYHGIYR